MVQFGLRIPPCTNAREVAREAARAEHLGFRGIWIPDSQLVWRDVWVTLALVATATSRVWIGTGVTNLRTRHLTVTASAAVSVDEVSNGRLRLGLGLGDSAVRSVDLLPSHVGALREAIATIRSLTGGASARESTAARLKAADHRIRPVPIYLGSAGPRMLQLAGELAEGALVLTGHDPESLAYVFANLRTGLERAGRHLDDIDITLALRCYIGDDWRTVRRQLRPVTAKYALRSLETLRAAGISLPDAAPREGGYIDLVHGDDPESVARAAEWVPQEVVELFAERHALIGDRHTVLRTIRRLVDSGIRSFQVVGLSSHTLDHETVDAFGRHVIPEFDTAGAT